MNLAPSIIISIIIIIGANTLAMVARAPREFFFDTRVLCGFTACNYEVHDDPTQKMHAMDDHFLYSCRNSK